MSGNTLLSRRHFLQTAGTLTGAAYLRLAGASLAALTQSACTARDEGAAFTVLGSDEAATLSAIAARIIPTTDTPGATEAGVIRFFDNALAGILENMLDGVRGGLASFDAALSIAHPDTSFDALDAAAQDAFLQTQQHTDFFNLVRLLTVFGFFSMQKYGGNKDHVGWDLIGFDGHKGAWEYPFGHYDAEVHGATSDGE